MVDGQSDKVRVAFVIQARMQSTRLPGKILFPLPFLSGKPVIKWIYDAVNTSAYQGDIIVATSLNPDNDVLQNYCDENNIECYRGDEDNVLSRFLDVAAQYKPQIIVRLTADNPLIDVAILDNVISCHVSNNNDYTHTKGLPLGMNFEVISSSALTSIDLDKTTDYDREHVTPYIKNNAFYKKDIYEVKTEPNFSRLRLTIDYPSDYLMLSALTAFRLENNLDGINLVKAAYKVHPWLFEVNNENLQKAQYSKEEELQAAVNLLEKHELKSAASIISIYRQGA